MAKKRRLFSELVAGMTELARMRINERTREIMTTTIEFRRWNSKRKYVFCFTEEGELKLFKTASVAETWAARQGFKAVFVESE